MSDIIMDMNEKLSLVVDICTEKLPDVLGIYLFGSQVTGETHGGSDLDLALLFKAGQGFDPVLMYHLQGKLVDVVGCSVDIGILNYDNVVFAKEVMTTGRRIYCRDEKKCDEFAMYCLTYYAQLNFERAEVLASYDVSEK